MERSGICVVFLVMVFIWINQMVRASEDAKFGQEKCLCPPSPFPIGGGSTPGTPSLNPPSGAGSSPATPSYSSPPPAIGTSPSTPTLTPPYNAPSGGSSSSPTTPSVPCTPPPRKSHSPSTPSHSSPPSPSSSSSSPTTPSYGTPPSGGSSSSPAAPSTPSYGTPPGDGIPSIGTSPVTPSPDFTPTTPSVPGFTPDGSLPGFPGSGTGTCAFWGSHASSLPNILSIFSSITDLFGSSSSFSKAWSSDMTLQQALTNTRKDGYGSLLREGSAALLNSLANPNFEFRPHEVRNQFNRALVSNHAAAVQGAKFKSANEGRLLP